MDKNSKQKFIVRLIALILAILMCGGIVVGAIWSIIASTGIV